MAAPAPQPKAETPKKGAKAEPAPERPSVKFGAEEAGITRFTRAGQHIAMLVVRDDGYDLVSPDGSARLKTLKTTVWKQAVTEATAHLDKA